METTSGLQSKVVRDLAWLIQAPPVLSEHAGMQLLALPDAAAERATQDWLVSLDQDPQELLSALGAQSGVRRLGFYAAALTQFWLENGPSWDTRRSLSAVPLSSGRSRITAGQLKLVCLRPREALHVESSVKFFADASSEEAPDLGTSSYVGPFLHENLAWRLAEARRKVTCTESLSVQDFLRRELGQVQLRSVYFLKGSTGWYTTDISAALNLTPGARLAVLPKLFWLGPAVARGDPPVILGEDLPGQQEAVATDWPDKVRQDVEEHFGKVQSALLLCELMPSTDGLWVEHSRGFVLPPVWDPTSLMTGQPQGMKSTAEHEPSAPDAPSKWSNQRRKYSERLADTARQPAPSLADAGVHIAVPQRLSEDLTAQHLTSYVLAAKSAARKGDGSRIQRKRLLHGAVQESEAATPGSVCRLVSEALQQLVEVSHPSDSHFLLELLVKPSEVGLAVRDCSLTFEAQPCAARRILDLGIAGGVCLRLAVKFAFRFQFSWDSVDTASAASLFEAALASDRSRLAGLVEYLAACSSLTLPVGSELSTAILQKLALPPADFAVLDLLCQHSPEHTMELTDILVSHGQLKLARKIEARRGDGSAPRVAVHESPEELPEIRLPAEVEVSLISDGCGLDALLQHLAEAGESVVGMDAEWKPWEGRGSDRGGSPVQLLQLAWAEVVYLLDMPALVADAELKLVQLLEILCSPSCILVGFNLEGDLRQLADSYPWLMSGAWRSTIEAVEMSGTSASLDGLCASVLGLRLEKSQQRSRWDLRPLSAQQLAYAALDAWVLLALLGARDSHLELPSLRTLASLPYGHAKRFTRRLELDGGVCAVASTLASLSQGKALQALVREHRSQVVVCKTLACVATLAAGARRLCLAVLPESAEMSLAQLTSSLGCASARLASTEELREHFRQPRGSVGPIGPALPKATVVLHQPLAENSLLSCGGGSPGWHLNLSPQQLQDWTDCIVAPIVAPIAS
ncbi:unnamed protein product [Effrenium voratum]|uniref:3'-5' exonuclease domain-containing protein n=1 Tax=Effrenium voratum TaxID=2562239 RepID=A0AA36IZ95_9DINO|nr:unnamed protein product [Effrenium voratum]